ncbi:MAG: globin family protein [Pseudolabrys sp.]|nr:globin family protein [Pseudolabrys sp.]MDP2293999.1 globin family protein [Pseudolabrys sp.]
MTPEQVSMVQESFKKVVPIAGTAADLFYGRLFEIAPEVRPLFPEDLKEQKKKLIAMLATAVTNLHQVEKIMTVVQDLGRRHVAYGVTAKQYEPVGAALLWTLEQGLGDDFTLPVKAAWTETYLTLAGVMQNAAADAAAGASPSNPA